MTIQLQDFPGISWWRQLLALLEPKPVPMFFWSMLKLKQVFRSIHSNHLSFLSIQPFKIRFPSFNCCYLFSMGYQSGTLMTIKQCSQYLQTATGNGLLGNSKETAEVRESKNRNAMQNRWGCKNLTHLQSIQFSAILEMSLSQERSPNTGPKGSYMCNATNVTCKELQTQCFSTIGLVFHCFFYAFLTFCPPFCLQKFSSAGRIAGRRAQEWLASTLGGAKHRKPRDKSTFKQRWKTWKWATQSPKV